MTPKARRLIGKRLIFINRMKNIPSIDSTASVELKMETDNMVGAFRKVLSSQLVLLLETLVAPSLQGVGRFT